MTEAEELADWVVSKGVGRKDKIGYHVDSHFFGNDPDAFCSDGRVVLAMMRKFNNFQMRVILESLGDLEMVDPVAILTAIREAMT